MNSFTYWRDWKQHGSWLKCALILVVCLAKPSGGWRRSLPTEAPFRPPLVSWWRGEARRPPKESSTRRFQRAERRRTTDRRNSRRGRRDPKEETWRQEEKMRNWARHRRAGPTLLRPRWSKRRRWVSVMKALFWENFCVLIHCNLFINPLHRFYNVSSIFW